MEPAPGEGQRPTGTDRLCGRWHSGSGGWHTVGRDLDRKQGCSVPKQVPKANATKRAHNPIPMGQTTEIFFRKAAVATCLGMLFASAVKWLQVVFADGPIWSGTWYRLGKTPLAEASFDWHGLIGAAAVAGIGMSVAMKVRHRPLAALWYAIAATAVFNFIAFQLVGRLTDHGSVAVHTIAATSFSIAACWICIRVLAVERDGQNGLR
jgi:hypothetical protein